MGVSLKNIFVVGMCKGIFKKKHGIFLNAYLSIFQS